MTKLPHAPTGTEAGKSQPQPKPAGKSITLSADEYDRLLGQAKQAEQYLRQLADLDNAKKRLQRDREEFTQYAAEKVIRELLPVLDSLSQALVAVDQPSDPQAVIQGVHLIYRQLLGLLEREGVQRISTIGEAFDPHQHEAVEQVDTDDHRADGTVVEEVQVGYTMHGKVIRPAMVKVASKPSGQKTEDRGQKTENRGQKTEDRGQKTENRGQKTEDRRQKTEDKGQKTEDSALEQTDESGQ